MGDRAVLSALLSHWTSSEDTKWRLGQFLQWAFTEKKVDLVRKLVINHVVDINMEIPESRGSLKKRTPLRLALRSWHNEMVEMMITEGPAIDYNARAHRNIGMFNCNEGRKAAGTIVRIAVRFGRLDVLQGICECLRTRSKRKVVELMNDRLFDYGQTALHEACLRKHTNVVQYLLETVQVNIHITDCYGATALDYANEKKCVEIIKLLKQYQKMMGMEDIAQSEA